MFRSLRPKPPPPLPLPFRNRRAEAERERRKAIERFANIEMDRATGFSWNRPRERVRARLGGAFRRNWGAGLGAVVMGVALVGAFLALSRLGLPDPPPTIIYVADWSGRPDLDRPAGGAARNTREAAQRAEALERERAAARAASPGP